MVFLPWVVLLVLASYEELLYLAFLSWAELSEQAVVEEWLYLHSGGSVVAVFEHQLA